MDFSVLISVYHKENPEFLKRAFESIWDLQSLKPSQIVLVEDGPLTDDLNAEIQRQKELLGERLTVVSLEKNVGLGVALAEGLKACKYDLVARMDTDDISIPNSVLDYKYQEAEYETVSDSTWYKPWTWGNTIEVLVQEEEHLFTINPKDLKNSIGQSMSEIIEQFCSKEQDNYKKTINSLKDINFKIFGEFKSNKQKEISKLQDDIKNSEKELVVVEKQLEDFNNLTKE